MPGAHPDEWWGLKALSDDRPLVEYFLSLPRDRDVDLSGLKHDPRSIAAPDSGTWGREERTLPP